jgi:hypothetical protein
VGRLRTIGSVDRISMISVLCGAVWCFVVLCDRVKQDQMVGEISRQRHDNCDEDIYGPVLL